MSQFATCLLFARIDIETVVRFIRSPKNVAIYNGLVILLLVVVGVLLTQAVLYLTKLLSSHTAENPRKLFMQLCKAHELSGGERKQLIQLANVLELSTPSILMIDAARWNLDELTLTHKITPKQHERLLTLQKTLYDQPRLSLSK